MPSAAPEPIVIVAGPTASGKSALALAVAEALGGTIINADSMQVYRDLAVLTARPGAAELARVPHRLYGVIDAAEACSAGRWRALALGEIAAAREAGRVPVLSGGTGLYLRALLDGLAPVPPVPAALREEARSLHARLGGEAFRRALAEVEALLARGLDPALPAMKAVGVPELASLLAGRSSRQAAIAAAQQATRRYAKRQYTWFGHQIAETGSLRKLAVIEQFSESLLARILPFIRQSLLTIKT